MEVWFGWSDFDLQKLNGLAKENAINLARAQGEFGQCFITLLSWTKVYYQVNRGEIFENPPYVSDLNP